MGVVHPRLNDYTLPPYEDQQTPAAGKCDLRLPDVAHCPRVPVCVSAVLIRMLYGVWQVDCSVYVMLLTTKVTYFGKWLEGKEKRPASFVDYLAYNLFFPGVIAGPTFSFDTYLDFVTGRY